MYLPGEGSLFQNRYEGSHNANDLLTGHMLSVGWNYLLLPHVDRTSAWIKDPLDSGKFMNMWTAGISDTLSGVFVPPEGVVPEEWYGSTDWYKHVYSSALIIYGGYKTIQAAQTPPMNTLDDIPADVWDEGAWPRGTKIDNAKAIRNNLGKNFPTVDGQNSRIVFSNKSYDTLHGYKRPGQLYHAMRKDINALNQFTNQSWKYNGVVKQVRLNQYDLKTLNAVFPSELSEAHLYEVRSAIQYANTLEGVKPIDVVLWKTK